MKPQKTIEATIAEVRKKDKKYNYIILIVFVLLTTSVIASLIIYAQDKKNKVIQQEVHTLSDQNDVNQELIEKYQFEFIENERLRRNDSLRTDSIARLVKTLREELAKIERDLNTKSMPGTDKATALTNVNLAQDKLNRITNNITDNTIIRYYKRKADGSSIERLIQSMKNPSFSLNLMQVANDNGRYKVNTIYYGENVKASEVSLLTKRLKAIGVDIKNISLFNNRASGYEWKNKSIEIGYESTDKVKPIIGEDWINNSNYLAENYNVRFYSYNPNEDIKKKLAEHIKKENYNLKTYPNWKQKPSFFSDVPTVFYYSDTSKAAAMELRDKLNKTNLGVKFTVQRGSGYGINKDELDNTFIIHYMQ